MSTGELKEREAMTKRVNMIVESEGKYYPFTFIASSQEEILLGIDTIIEDIRETFSGKWCIHIKVIEKT